MRAAILSLSPTKRAVAQSFLDDSDHVFFFLVGWLHLHSSYPPIPPTEGWKTSFRQLFQTATESCPTLFNKSSNDILNVQEITGTLLNIQRSYTWITTRTTSSGWPKWFKWMHFVLSVGHETKCSVTFGRMCLRLTMSNVLRNFVALRRCGVLQPPIVLTPLKPADAHELHTPKHNQSLCCTDFCHCESLSVHSQTSMVLTLLEQNISLNQSNNTRYGTLWLHFSTTNQIKCWQIIYYSLVQESFEFICGVRVNEYDVKTIVRGRQFALVFSKWNILLLRL